MAPDASDLAGGFWTRVGANLFARFELDGTFRDRLTSQLGHTGGLWNIRAHGSAGQEMAFTRESD
jgi:hypothetical protein